MSSRMSGSGPGKDDISAKSIYNLNSVDGIVSDIVSAFILSDEKLLLCYVSANMHTAIK
jgi:hypothetical protein